MSSLGGKRVGEVEEHSGNAVLIRRTDGERVWDGERVYALTGRYDTVIIIKIREIFPSFLVGKVEAVRVGDGTKSPLYYPAGHITPVKGSGVCEIC